MTMTNNEHKKAISRGEQSLDYNGNDGVDSEGMFWSFKDMNYYAYHAYWCAKRNYPRKPQHKNTL